MEWERDGYVISTDRDRLDVDVIHGFLRSAYWSPNVPRSIENSVCFGLYGPDGAQAGFARALTDKAAFAYLADVFVLEPHRGRGLGKWLVETVLSHPDLQRSYSEALPYWRPEDVAGSPYAIARYEVPPALGGEAGLAAPSSVRVSL